MLEQLHREHYYGWTPVRYIIIKTAISFFHASDDMSDKETLTFRQIEKLYGKYDGDRAAMTCGNYLCGIYNTNLGKYKKNDEEDSNQDKKNDKDDNNLGKYKKNDEEDTNQDKKNDTNDNKDIIDFKYLMPCEYDRNHTRKEIIFFGIRLMDLLKRSPDSITTLEKAESLVHQFLMDMSKSVDYDAYIASDDESSDNCVPF
jgi:hypothetical protein